MEEVFILNIGIEVISKSKEIVKCNFLCNVVFHTEYTKLKFNVFTYLHLDSNDKLNAS